MIVGMFLALDQGTTSSRALVFDRDGGVVGRGQCEFEQHFPAPGWVEHEPGDIVESQLAAARAAIGMAGQPAIAAVGITNQRETVVVWDRANGRPVHRAIVWQDRRTAGVLGGLAEHGELVRARTGLSLDPYFSAAKIAWILDRVDGARARAERGELAAGTVDSWLLWSLTGGEVFATDATNASRTCLFDLGSGDWSDELCAIFRVPRACLPEVRASAADFGTAVGSGWPLRAVLGDQQSALFGHGCIAAGDTKCTYGTGAFALTNAGGTRPETAPGVLATVAWRLGDATTFAQEGSVLVCGAAIQWLRDQLGIVQRADETEALARSVSDSGGIVFVPAFAGLGTPHWDPSARGAILGLTRGTTKAHLARAALEALALQVDDMLTAMGGERAELHVDGGAAGNGLLLELQAALLGAPVVRPALLEATAFGAFRMSLLGAEVCRDLAELPALPGDPTVVPPPSDLDVTELRERWAKALPRTRGWA
ncbi:MAG: glycerol kinase GlpK [Planctomycetes bacterium]|nr:glycerol kinase GlpK [Planctomycetota bacterium]